MMPLMSKILLQVPIILIVILNCISTINAVNGKYAPSLEGTRILQQEKVSQTSEDGRRNPKFFSLGVSF